MAKEPVKNNFIFFTDLSPEEWETVKPLLHEITLKKGEILFEEGSQAKELYFIKEGALDVIKEGHRLSVLEPGDWVGEIAALLNDIPRTASVHAKEATVLSVLSLSELKEATKDRPDVYVKIITHLSRSMAHRLRLSSESVISSVRKKLEHAKIRLDMGQFIFYVLVIISTYFFAIKIIDVLQLNARVSTFVSIPIIFILAVMVFFYFGQLDYPLRTYGLTFKNWKRAITESVLYSVPALAFFVFLKWLFITFIPMFSSRPLFNLPVLLAENLSTVDWLVLTLGYAVFVPLQEIMARGCLQGSLEKFLVGKRKVLVAIFLSNLIFSVLHLQFSLQFAIIVFFFGIFWGWLYSRHRTIVGVSISHMIVGIIGHDFIGFL